MHGDLEAIQLEETLCGMPFLVVAAKEYDVHAITDLIIELNGTDEHCAAASTVFAKKFAAAHQGKPHVFVTRTKGALWDFHHDVWEMVNPTTFMTKEVVCYLAHHNRLDDIPALLQELAPERKGNSAPRRSPRLSELYRTKG